MEDHVVDQAVEAVDPVHMDPDQTMAYTQGKRRQVIEAITKNKEFVNDTKQTALVLHALDGMDRQAIGIKRIKIDEKANDTAAGAAGIIAEFFHSMHHRQALKRPEQPAEMVGRRAAPTIGVDLPDTEVVEGELATSPLNLTYDQFQSQFTDVADSSGSEAQ